MSIIVHDPSQPIAWRQGGAIPAQTLLDDVHRLAAALPEARYLFNLCEDRYRFMVGFLAAMHRDQISLMPSNSTPGAINELMHIYEDSYCLTDNLWEGIEGPGFDFEQLLGGQSLSRCCEAKLDFPDDQLVAILFTSGSTGRPKPNTKSWYNLKQEAIGALDHFPFHNQATRSLVATVPPQHMYGLATSVLFPWRGGFGVDAGRPFFPADIARALSQVPEPRVLITTPLHLRACVSAGIEWPSIAFVISATAPLSRELALRAEADLNTEIYEIYGSTETGSVAGRRTVREEFWCLYDGITLHPDGSSHHILGNHLLQPVRLNDHLRLESGSVFSLLGRDSDMVKIAGKRVSLRDLTHQLTRIPGVEDGLFLPPADDSATARLCALVVAPTLTRKEVFEVLSNTIDPVFLPRPLYRVDRLPRNSTGKITQAALQELLQSLRENTP